MATLGIANSLNSLPTEILLQILLYIDGFSLTCKVRLVSRRFNSLVLATNGGKIYGLYPSLWEKIISNITQRYTIEKVRLISSFFKGLIDDSQFEDIRRWLWKGRIPLAEERVKEWTAQVHPLLCRPWLRYNKEAFRGKEVLYTAPGFVGHQAATIPPVSSVCIAVRIPQYGYTSKIRRETGLPLLAARYWRHQNSGNVITVNDINFIIEQVILRYWLDNINVEVRGGYLYATEGALTEDLLKSLDEGNESLSDLPRIEKSARRETAAMMKKMFDSIVDRALRYSLYGRCNERSSLQLAVVWQVKDMVSLEEGF
ncbi:hypothetical protein ABW20_dc0106537 [Dactylellina cionopaga]|nr:hypothetical protein ABW20_dc0106537 [Dactylellina cionopaga]